jgi:hypothetical protein
MWETKGLEVGSWLTAATARSNGASGRASGPDHGGGDRGGSLASMYGETEIGNRHAEPREDLILSGDEAGSVERRRRRDEEQWIRAGELPFRSRGAVDRSDTGERT